MPHGPNCVAMAKKSGNYYIAAADGVPNQATADAGFYLFEGATGDSLWGTAPNFQFTTAKMNYVIAMSSDGSAAFGGSNDGNVYYFAVP